MFYQRNHLQPPSLSIAIYLAYTDINKMKKTEKGREKYFCCFAGYPSILLLEMLCSICHYHNSVLHPGCHSVLVEVYDNCGILDLVVKSHHLTSIVMSLSSPWLPISQIGWQPPCYQLLPEERATIELSDIGVHLPVHSGVFLWNKILR